MKVVPGDAKKKSARCACTHVLNGIKQPPERLNSSARGSEADAIKLLSDLDLTLRENPGRAICALHLHGMAVKLELDTKDLDNGAIGNRLVDVYRGLTRRLSSGGSCGLDQR